MRDFPQTLFADHVGITIPNDDESFRDRLGIVFEMPDVSRLPPHELIERQQAEPGLEWHPLERRMLEELLRLMGKCSVVSREVDRLLELYNDGILLPLKTRRLWRRANGEIGQSSRHWCLKTRRLFVDRVDQFFFPEFQAFRLLSGGVYALSEIRSAPQGEFVLMADEDIKTTERRVVEKLRAFAIPWQTVLAEIGFNEAQIDEVLQEGLGGI